MPTATIRDATRTDLPRLLELLWQLSEQSEYPEQGARAAGAGHEAALERIADDPSVRLLVLDDGEAVVGTLTLYVLPNLSHGGRPLAIVENVVVDQNVRGTGYGRRLMKHAERLAAAAGCYKVSLTSNRQRLAAHAFYRRIGYQASHVGFTRYTVVDAELSTEG